MHLILLSQVALMHRWVVRVIQTCLTLQLEDKMAHILEVCPTQTLHVCHKTCADHLRGCTHSPPLSPQRVSLLVLQSAHHHHR